MTQSTDLASPAARFSEAVRAFAPVCTSRYAKLLPFKDDIVELRQKGASYRLIREMLATAAVAIAVGTIGNLVREVVEQRPPSRPGTRRRLSERCPSAVRAASGSTPAHSRRTAISVHRGAASRGTRPCTGLFRTTRNDHRSSRQQSVHVPAARASPTCQSLTVRTVTPPSHKQTDRKRKPVHLYALA